jgi:hypothetical protein
MAQITIITCDNCGQETKRPTVLQGYDICTDCLEGKMVLQYDEISNWPRWVTRTAVVDALRHYEMRVREKQTTVKVSEVNKHLEAEVLNLPTDDPTKLIRDVQTLQNRVRRTKVSAA